MGFKERKRWFLNPLVDLSKRLEGLVNWWIEIVRFSSCSSWRRRENGMRGRGMRRQHVEGDGKRQNKMLGFSYDVFICVLLGLGFIEFQMESHMS